MNKTILIIIFFSLLLISCSKNKDRTLKTFYSAECSIDPDTYIVTDTISSILSTYYENGSLKSVQYLHGFRKDETDNFRKGTGPKDKIEGEYTYHYLDDHLIRVTTTKKDTTYYFTPDNINEVYAYIIKKDGRMIEFYKSISSTKQTIIKWIKYSDNYKEGIFREEYVLTEFDKKEMPEIELDNYTQGIRRYIKSIEKLEYW